MKKTRKTLLSIGLILVLLLGCLPTQAFAMGPDKDPVITGSYYFTSNELSNIQETDTFEWRDSCFWQSSFEGCDHLKLLSAQAAIASDSRYGDQLDQYEVDHSDCGHNIKNMLTDMGFRDVSTNDYYQVETLENSAAVAVGHRTIKVGNRKYTLLAIIPRSAGYKQEWAGNFTVGKRGNEKIHRGFKAGRDEILRFVKTYMKENNIRGDLKVWIAGHSRGGALASLVGGFFAGGGIGYFGRNVNITPEDVYCYTFATPRTIIAGLSKGMELSVEGYRGGEYAKDTKQAPYYPVLWGQVDPEDSVYNGIRNYPLSHDIITYLPPAEWGFTYYGKVCSMTESENGIIDPDAMEKELEKVSPYIYGRWKDGGDYRLFRQMDFDLASLDMVPVEDGLVGREGMTAFVAERVHGLAGLVPSRKEYQSEGYQEVLAELGALYGMTINQFPEQLSESVGDLIMPGVLCYLAYASDRLQKEGRADTEAEAVTIALVELVDYLTGCTEENAHDPNMITTDEFLLQVLTYIVDHEDSPMMQSLQQLLMENIPEGYEGLFIEVFKEFVPIPEDCEDSEQFYPPMDEVLFYTLKACVYGIEEGSTLYGIFEDAAEVRSMIVMLLGSLLEVDLDLEADLTETVEGTVLPMLLQETDEDGEVIEEYESLAEAADAKLGAALEQLFGSILAYIEAEDIAYPDSFVEEIRGHLTNLLQPEHIAHLRMALCSLLFANYEKDSEGNFTQKKPFDTAQNVRNGATFIEIAKMIPLAHYNEVFVAWGKAGVRNASEHPEPAREPSKPSKSSGPKTDPDSKCPLDDFDDAFRTAWYHDGVHYVLEKGIMAGLGDRKFGPNEATTRAMMAQILWNLEGRPAVDYVDNYSDVAKGDWYAQAVTWATKEGIMKGYGDGTFGSSDPLTREQLVTVFYRWKSPASDPQPSVLDPYTDAGEISPWALDAFRWALEAGIVEGTGNNKLSPGKNSTRAEIATIVMRYCTGIGA